jgi:hypothetical protein
MYNDSAPRTILLYRPPNPSVKCLLAGGYCERKRASRDETPQFSSDPKRCEWCGRRFVRVFLVARGRPCVMDGDADYLGEEYVSSLEFPIFK